MISKENRNTVEKHNEVGRNIVSDFYSYWCIFKRHWFPAVAIFSSVVALSAFYAFKKTPIYRTQGQLLFEEDKASSLIGLESSQKGSSQGSGLTSVERMLDTQIRVLYSEPVLKRTVEQVNKNKLRGLPLEVEDLKAGLSIRNVIDTNVIQVAYQSTNPEVAALVVNQLMNNYVYNNLADNRSTAVAARQFITEQLPKVRQNVVSADTTLRSFKEKYKIIDLNATKTAVTTNGERIQSQIDSAEVELAKLNSQSSEIQKKLQMTPQEIMAVSSLSQSSVVQGLLTELQDVERKLIDAKARYQPGNPTVVHLQNKQAQAKAQIQAQFARVLPGRTSLNGKFQIGQTQQELMNDLLKGEVTRIGLVNQVAALNNQKALYQKQADILPEVEQQQRELERNLKVAESTYEALLKSLQEIRIKENQALNNVRVIESAMVPDTPMASNQVSTLLAGGLGGIMLAVAVIYVLEAKDKKIKTVQEARELFEYKLLGTIPVFSRTKRNVSSNTSKFADGQLPVIDKPRSAISESYRMLQANLKFLDAFNAAKVIVVTSSVPKEGKSTLCANLAATMAQIGQKVLIIDADMHRPTQHEIWKISNHEEGLSNIITEPASLETKFHKVIDNLNVVTSGFLPPNPLAVIESKSMATFLEECSKNYDYVFIDTPPLASTADAVTLGRMVDGVLIVIRPLVADSNSSNLAKEYLEQSGQKVLGIVVNGVLRENEPHRSQSHYYSQN